MHSAKTDGVKPWGNNEGGEIDSRGCQSTLSDGTRRVEGYTRKWGQDDTRGEEDKDRRSLGGGGEKVTGIRKVPATINSGGVWT